MEVDARVIRRSAWTLPAAELLLGAPWIKLYFAGSVDLTGEVETKTSASTATAGEFSPADLRANGKGSTNRRPASRCQPLEAK
jgi:hypothetical protein